MLGSVQTPLKDSGCNGWRSPTMTMMMMLEEGLPPVEAMVTDWLCQRERRERAARQPQMHVMHFYNLLISNSHASICTLQVYCVYSLVIMHYSALLLNISNTVCFILQCSAVKAPIAPPGRAPVENGDTEDTSPSLTMLLPLICCVIGPMLCKSHRVCSRDTCLRSGLTDVSRTSPPPSLPCGFHTH